MEWLQLIVLALIQGLTEFLPVSSSAHLILPSQLWGWQDQGLAFDVAVHVGTLLAVIFYYRRSLAQMTQGSVRALAQRQLNADASLVLKLALATLPAVIAGLLFKDVISAYARSIQVIGITTIVFGVLLGWSQKRGQGTRELAQITLGIALLIGLAQALALIPGTSRSGITLTMALFLGLRREASAHFSFLLSIPLILGALLLLLKDVGSEPQLFSHFQLLIAASLSAVVAFLSIGFFIRLLNRIGVMPFVWYRLVLGALLLGIAWL